MRASSSLFSGRGKLPSGCSERRAGPRAGREGRQAPAERCFYHICWEERNAGMETDIAQKL